MRCDEVALTRIVLCYTGKHGSERSVLWHILHSVPTHKVFVITKISKHCCLHYNISFKNLVPMLQKAYNHFHNILRLLDVLPNFLFTTSETMRDYYLWIWYLRVIERVAKRLKTNEDLRNIKKISKLLKIIF